MLKPSDPVRKMCEQIADNDSLKLKADIEELANRYRPVVRDMLIVITNPDTPERISSVVTDELQFGLREMLDRVDARRLETAETFLPLLLAFQDLSESPEQN